MNKTMMIVCGSLIGLLLMLLALVIWEGSGNLVRAWKPQQPKVVLWAVCAAAIAAASAAQGVVLLFVIGQIYRPRLVDSMLRMSAGLVFVIASVCAVALGLAGR